MITKTVDVLKEKKVILIDDDPDFLFQQEQILKNAGCEVFTATNRKDAERLLRTEKAAAVIVDLMIDDDDDGFVLAYKAKKSNPDMPVIMVTNIAGETGMEFGAETAEEQSWIKADVVLSKPVRAEQIIGELTRLIGE